MSQRGRHGYPDGFEPSTSGVKIVGLAEFRKELRALEGETNWARELTRGMREIAKTATGWAQDEATAMGGQQRHFADALKGRAAGIKARIEVAGPSTPKGKTRANPAFWGTKAQGNWIGASWGLGVLGEGPYAINAALYRHGEDLVDEMGDLVEEISKQAFPN